MSLLAHLDSALGETKQTDSLTVLDSGSVEKNQASVTNVESFPAPAGSVRVQDVVLQMLLRGIAYEEIAIALKKDVRQVELIAQSTWMEQELEKSVKATSETEPLDQLVRVQGFKAIQVLGNLLRSDKESIQLQACKLALSYTMSPQRDKDFLKKRNALSSADPEALARELTELERKIDSHHKH